MFLLLMPVFAAPLEALAAFCECVMTKLLLAIDAIGAVFMAAGVPMYYLTARSRESSKSGAALSNEERGVKATLQGMCR